MQDQLFTWVSKSLREGLSDEEEAAFSEWLQRDTANQKMVDEYRTIWSLARQTAEPPTDMERAMQKEQLMMAIKQYDTPASRSSRNDLNNDLKQWIAAAVISVSLLAGAGYYFFIERERVYTSANIPTVLPDSTVIILDNNARLSFRATPEKRLIHISGQAFLDVFPNKQRPLYIYIKEYVVKVVGTSLVIRAVDHEFPEVSVISGTVQIFTAHNNIIVLNASESLTLDGETLSNHNTGKSENADAWITHELRFDNTPLVQVVHDLENYYGITFKPLPPEMKNCGFTGTFKNEDLNLILKLLAITFNTEVSNSNGTYVMKNSHCNEQTLP